MAEEALEAARRNMRFLELELDSDRALEGIDPPLKDVLAAAAPTEDDLFLLDRPDGAVTRLTRVRGESAPEAVGLPTSRFFPRLLADDGEGSVLAVGVGAPHNALLLDAEGRERGRYDLGEEIADVAYDPDGNLVVLRMTRKGRRTLMDRYGPDGDRVVRDDQIERIAGHTEQTRGTMILVQRDGTVWLNLAEKYTVDGELLDAINPAEVFGPGRVSADLLGWDGIVVLTEKGRVAALLPKGQRRPIRIPEALVRSHLGRRLSAATDFLLTREDRLSVVTTDVPRVLRFRVLSE